MKAEMKMKKKSIRLFIYLSIVTLIACTKNKQTASIMNNSDDFNSIFDSSHKYESGKFNLIKNEQIKLITDALDEAIAIDIEYNIKVDDTLKVVVIGLSKESATNDYENIKKNIVSSFGKRGIDMEVRLFLE